MVDGDAQVFSGFLTPVLTVLSFQSYLLLFSHAFSRGERQKYAGKKVGFNRVSNSEPSGHESDMLTTELPGIDRSKFVIWLRVHDCRCQWFNSLPN